nr:endonuclease/exonuclease/phosphatase family protein [Streptomyces tsukubensis]
MAGIGVVVGFRAADSDGVTPVPQLLAFLPWLSVPTALALLLAVAARWRTGMVWGALTLAVLGWFVLHQGERQPEGGPGAGPVTARLRVLTSNVEFGGATDGLLTAIRRERPDIVFVEECEYRCSAALLDAGYPYHRAVASAGSRGSLILSRHPLRGAPGVRATMGMPGAVADVGGTDIRLQLAHPMPPLPDQLDVWRRELGRLAALAEKETGPLVMAGDFNASADHAAFRSLLAAGRLRDGARLSGSPRTASWPARTASVFGAQIDHVLVSGGLDAHGARFLGLPDTDHRALVMDLTLR